MLTMAVGQSDEVAPSGCDRRRHRGVPDRARRPAPQAGILFSAFDSFDPSIVAAVRDAFPGVTRHGLDIRRRDLATGGYQEDSVTLALFASDVVDVTTGLGTRTRQRRRGGVPERPRPRRSPPRTASRRSASCWPRRTSRIRSATLDAMARRAAGRSGHRRRDVGGPRRQCRAAVVPVLRRRGGR